MTRERLLAGLPVRELVDLTCAERPALVAHSLFGTPAARFAAHGDSLARLVVHASPAIGRHRMPLGLRIVATRFALRPNERNGARFDARAASTRLGWPSHMADDAGRLAHLEQPDTFGQRLTHLPAAAPVSAREADG